jgi:hypothetical protein
LIYTLVINVWFHPASPLLSSLNIIETSYHPSSISVSWASSIRFSHSHHR